MRIATNHTRRLQGRWRVALLSVLAFLLTAGRLAAVIQPGLETVSLYVNVEKSGGLVTGLTQQNFRLYQDGEPQPFRLEKPEEPASIALLVEYSRSSGYYYDDITAAIQGFLRHAPEGNWYALATYSHGLEINVDFTRQIGKVTEAFGQLGPPTWNEVDTYDAVYDMLDKMGRLPGRRVLVVVGSGFDTFSEHKLDDVKKKIESEDITVFVAGAGSVFRGIYGAYIEGPAKLNLIQAQAFLQMLASKSGGFAWFPNQFNAFPDVLEGIMQSIATQYRLVYQTTARGSGKFHKIKVEAFRIVDDKRENFKVLVREGWR